MVTCCSQSRSLKLRSVSSPRLEVLMNLATFHDRKPPQTIAYCLRTQSLDSPGTSDEDCKGAREIVHQRWPAAKILSMTTGDRSCRMGIEPAVRGLDGPSVLLQRMDVLLHPLGQSRN